MSLSYHSIQSTGFDPAAMTSPVAGTPRNLPQIDYFSATPTRSCKKPSVSSELVVPKYKRTQWVYEDSEDESLASRPGHAVYYKSRKFQDKVAAGKVHGHRGFQAKPEFSKRGPTKLAKQQSLVMIFGLNNVRRAKAGKKANLRLQKHNKRA